MNRTLLIALSFVLVFASAASAEYRDVLPYSSQLYLDTNTIGVSNTNEFTIKQGANLDSSVIIRMNRTNKNTATAGIHGTVSIYPDTTAASNSATITLAGTTGALSAGAITGTGTVTLSGSSIGLGNSVAADSVTITADVIAASNAYFDLNGSGVTVDMATVGIDALTVNTSAALPANSIGGAELTDSAATKYLTWAIDFDTATIPTGETICLFKADCAVTVLGASIGSSYDLSAETYTVNIKNITGSTYVVAGTAATAGTGINVNNTITNLTISNGTVAAGDVVSVALRGDGTELNFRNGYINNVVITIRMKIED